MNIYIYINIYIGHTYLYKKNRPNNRSFPCIGNTSHGLSMAITVVVCLVDRRTGQPDNYCNLCVSYPCEPLEVNNTVLKGCVI